ncbi:hypothetical protein MF451_003766 [Salmonella enterica subsp. enterica serovar Saintpaul]|nr:hypothetical protein [Salmonella enterica subsp. enterica serovar Saintpaul]
MRSPNKFAEHAMPVNKDAARSMKRGEHYSSSKRIQEVESDNPFPVMPEALIGGDQFHTLPNLTGIRRGRLMAYGYVPGLRKWACRCDCGKYTLRSTKAMNNDKNLADACGDCRELLFLKREEIWRREGKRVEYYDLL